MNSMLIRSGVAGISKEVLQRAGEMGRRVAELDWSATPLGSMDTWSAELVLAVSTCLISPFPVALWCGPDLIGIYNDQYRELLGTKHPAALGRSYRETWIEIWPDVQPLFRRVEEQLETLFFEDYNFTVERGARIEEAYFTFGLTPIVDETGRVRAIQNVAFETTRRIRAIRRLDTLARISTAAVGTHSRWEFARELAGILEQDRTDVVSASIYLVSRDETLVAEHAAGHVEFFNEAINLADPESDAIASALSTASLKPFEFDGRHGLVVPLIKPDVLHALGLLIVESNPLVPVDIDYINFIAAIGQQASTSMAVAYSREIDQERLAALSESEARFRQMAETAEKARAEAEAANRAKSDFLASMSHELRTPLNAIAGYVDLLDYGVHGNLGDQQRDALRRISANQRHLLTLINDLLTFAKVEAGKMKFEIEKLHVSELLETLGPFIHPQAAARDISYSVEPCDPDLFLLGDRERVQQILLNLVGNAVKFTQRGGQVSVRCRRVDDRIAIAVEDNGPGIPKGKHEVIFDPFVQVERRLDRPQEGTGLGLAISRDLARAMNGDVLVDSAVGRGSTFTVLLPSS